MDRNVNKPKPSAFFSKLSGDGERVFFRRAFPEVVVSHAHRESVSKRRPSRWAIAIGILSLSIELFSQWSGAGTTGVSLLQIVALPVICSQVRVKKHGEGQSSCGATGGSGAGSMGGSRGGGGDENGRIGSGIGEGRRSGMGGGAQRRGNEDDDDNDGRHMVGNVENGRNRRPEDIANTFLPIILQSIAIITAIDRAQLSTTGRVIRSLSMIINLAGFICCTAVLWPLHTNPGVARMLNPRIAGILSSIGSALAVLGFVSMMATYLPF